MIITTATNEMPEYLDTYILCLLLSSADFFFSKLTFSKNSFRNTIRVSNSLDPDQDRHSVGPDLGSNCLQRLSADDKTHGKQGMSSRGKYCIFWPLYN